MKALLSLDVEPPPPHLSTHSPSLSLRLRQPITLFTQLMSLLSFSIHLYSRNSLSIHLFLHRFISKPSGQRAPSSTTPRGSTHPTASTRKSQDDVFLNDAFFNKSGERPSSTAILAAPNRGPHPPRRSNVQAGSDGRQSSGKPDGWRPSSSPMTARRAQPQPPQRPRA
jgi:hypothetical protein